MQAAVTDGTVPNVAFAFDPSSRCGWDATGDRRVGAGFDVVAAVSLDDALRRLGAIDLLKIGCPASLLEIVQQAAGTGLTERIHWLCGRLAGADCSEVMGRLLSRTHVVDCYTNEYGAFVFAKRIT